jgi:hypothetical protein
MKHFELMVEELQGLIEVPVTKINSSRYRLSVGILPTTLDYSIDDNGIVITVVFGALKGELPDSLYHLVLNANACGAQLDGGKLAIDKQTNQILLVKLLHSSIENSELLAQSIIGFMEVVAFWQSVLINADFENLVTNNTLTTDNNIAMISV